MEKERIFVTAEEITKYKLQLSDYPEELKALDEISECDGDLLDALTVLAIQNGEQISRSGKWLSEVTGKAREVICNEEFRDELLAGSIAGLVEALLASSAVPPGLASPIVIFAVKIGVRNFCGGSEVDKTP